MGPMNSCTHPQAAGRPGPPPAAVPARPARPAPPVASSAPATRRMQAQVYVLDLRGLAGLAHMRTPTRTLDQDLARHRRLHPRPPAAASPGSNEAPASTTATTATSDASSSSSSSSTTHLHRLDAADTAPGFGPRGVLLVGLSSADAAAVEAWFGAMEPGFAVSHATGAMLEETVRDAVFGAGTNGTDGSFSVVPFTARPTEVKLPRLALFAGMAPQEMVAIAENWGLFTGTADPVLVSLLPGMLARPLGEVILEATRAAASARATGGRAPGGPDADRMDGATLKAAVRAKVEERRAGKGRGGPLISLEGDKAERAVVVDGGAAAGGGGASPTVEDIKAALQRAASNQASGGRRAGPGKKGAGPQRGFGAAGKK